MRRTLASLLAAAVAFGTLGTVALVLAAPVKKEKEKEKDEDAIQGTWKIDSFDNGGNARGGPPPGEIEKIRFEFKKDGKMAMTGGPGGPSREGEYKMDPSAKVKTIDLIHDGRPALGIYELDGDTLKLCVAEGQNAARPEEMKADGKGVAVVTMKRVKEEKKEEKKDK